MEYSPGVETPSIRPARNLSLGASLVGKLLPHAGVETIEMDPRLAPTGEDLLPLERVAIVRAVEKRQRQYTAGRMLARQLLAQRGVRDFALLNDEQRVPRWPTGMVGCITHTDLWCAVAIGSGSKFRGLGIDVEPATPLAPSLWESIARGDELSWIAQQPESQQGLLCKGLFSAKESIYKALYPELRQFLGFEAMRIEIQPLSGTRFTWSATLQQQWGGVSAGQCFPDGQMLMERGLLVTAIVVPR